MARWGGTERLPWDPVADHLDREAGEPLSRNEHARRLGINNKQVYRWDRGGMPPVSADRVAIGLGLHPFELWGDDWWTP